MTSQPMNLVNTVESMRDRAQRLEHEAAELRAELDEMVVLLGWRLDHVISTRALQRIAVTAD